VDFRAQAKDSAGDRWRGMSEPDRRRLIAAERKSWTARAIGQVPAETNYAEWIKAQPAEFQTDVLGVTKAKLLRTGKLTVREFVDRRGQTLSLSDLAKKDPSAFIAAGLDPDEFR
jgi:hypothetical protein